MQTGSEKNIFWNYCYRCKLVWDEKTSTLSVPAGERILLPVDLSVFNSEKEITISVGAGACVFILDQYWKFLDCPKRKIELKEQSSVWYYGFYDEKSWRICEALLDEEFLYFKNKYFPPTVMVKSGLKEQESAEFFTHNQNGASELTGGLLSITVCLQGESSRFHGLIRGCAEQVEAHVAELWQEHQAAKTESRFDVRQILSAGGESTVHGAISISKAAAHGYAEQQIKSIIQEGCLGRPVSMRPELHVANNTARVLHGCATGGIDQEQLFFLLSRGLSLEGAKRLIFKGFLACAQNHDRLRG